MRKLIGGLVAVLAVMSLASCGESAYDQVEAKDPTITREQYDEYCKRVAAGYGDYMKNGFMGLDATQFNIVRRVAGEDSKCQEE